MVRNYTSVSGVEVLTVKPEILTLGIDEAWLPFQYKDGNSLVNGFDVELAIAIAEKLGLKVKIATARLDRIQVMLRAGKIDAIIGLPPTAGRRKIFSFSEPYATRGTAIFVLEDSPIMKIKDL